MDWTLGRLLWIYERTIEILRYKEAMAKVDPERKRLLKILTSHALQGHAAAMESVAAEVSRAQSCDRTFA